MREAYVRYRMAGDSKICSRQLFPGGKIFLWGPFGICWTKRGHLKCTMCQRQKGSKFLRRELNTLPGFHQQQPAFRLAKGLGLNYKAVRRVVQRLRETMFHVTGLEAGRLRRRIESDETCFGGHPKRSDDVAQRDKALLLVSRSARDVSRRERSSLFLPKNCRPVLERTRKGSITITCSFRSCRSLKKF